MFIHSIMTTPNKPKPKASRLAKMVEKSTWKRKPSPHNNTITSNGVEQPSIPPTIYFPNFNPNPQSHSFEPYYNPYNPGQNPIIPSFNYNDPYNYGQSSNHNPNIFPSNYTTPTKPPHLFQKAAEEQKLRGDLNVIRDLSDLNAMHLAQRNKDKPPSSPYSNCLPHPLNLDQVTNHTYYCPCCYFLQKQLLDLSQDISWIEYLLTRPHPLPPLARYNHNPSIPYPPPQNH